MAAVLYPLGHKIKSAPAQVLQKALALDVVLSVSDGKLHAAGDRASVQELAPLLRQHRDDLVGLLTHAANDPAPGTTAATTARFRAASMALDAAAGAQAPTPAPTAYDPGEAALLALAMAYCSYTGASDKARAQWQQDAADTPPELRGDLYQHLREQLPPAPPAPPKPHPAPAPKPMGWLHMEQPWRAADRLYQSHHWQCAACMASARAAPGTADRCTEGQRLHDEYTSEGHHHD